MSLFTWGYTIFCERDIVEIMKQVGPRSGKDSRRRGSVASYCTAGSHRDPRFSLTGVPAFTWVTLQLVAGPWPVGQVTSSVEAVFPHSSFTSSLLSYSATLYRTLLPLKLLSTLPETSPGQSLILHTAKMTRRLRRSSPITSATINSTL